MLSAIQRYRLQLTVALTRYFPRTSAYLRSEGSAALLHGKARPRATQAAAEPVPSRRAKAGKAPGKARSKPTAADRAIYGPALISVSSEQIAAMRARVSQAVAAKLLSEPSPEQWAMILERNPLTRVFAAAGSGKSSTLLLRVVFMLCHLRIPAEQLTVISFTNASCSQLREQLSTLLAFWPYTGDAAQAQNGVRTFHAAMAMLAKPTLGNPRWFEQLASSGAAQALDNPLTNSRLRPAQSALLKQAYQQCYSQQAAFRQLVHQLLKLPAPAPDEAASPAPLATYQLSGEFSAVPLFEAFYQQAGFIHSIGLRIEHLQARTLLCAATERGFIEALVLFWPCFMHALHEQGLHTFDGAFAQLTDNLNSPNSTLTASHLAPFSHLLIDEFQDISPQIVLWLNALQRALVRQGSVVSLMAIGDDWQSIYGWRGSSPELFIDFDKHFPGSGKARHSTLLQLQNNYRSIEPIIRDAEGLLSAVRHKHNKISHAMRATQTGEHGVKLISSFDLKQQLPALVSLIQAQCALVAASGAEQRTGVLVMSRRNAPLQLLRPLLDKKLPVKLCTIHSAKGLQAQVAIILDDCPPVSSHPLREALYAHAGFFHNSYAQALQDESLRLAYVAITRGVSRVFWYCHKPQGATQLLLQRGA